MMPGMKRRRMFSAMLPGVLVLLSLTCYLLVGCGSTPPPDQPLTAGTMTSVVSSSPTATVGVSVVPISVVTTQTSLSSYPGGPMQLAITTSPYAICNLLVSYGLATPSKASGILPHTADATGVVHWNWQVDTTAHTGTWPLTVTAIMPNGAETSSQINVTITFVPVSVVTARTTLTALPKQDMLLTVQTAPSVTCTIVLNFGAAAPAKTIIHHVGQDGTVSFTWKVVGNAAPGVYVLPVTITLVDGEQSSISENMTVLKP